MPRRRLVLIVLIAIVALGLCGTWIGRLSSEEQQLLGKWYRRMPPNSVWPGGAVMVHDYAPDHTCRVYSINGPDGTVRQRADGRNPEIRFRWRIRGGELVNTYDVGMGPVERLRRWLPPRFPGAVSVEPDVYPIERLTADELVFRDRFEHNIRLTRVQPD